MCVCGGGGGFLGFEKFIKYIDTVKHKFFYTYRGVKRRDTDPSSLGRYVFGSEISYNKAPPRLPGLGC